MTSESEHRILIVEDDASIRRFLRISLEAHGFVVAETALGEPALAMCGEFQPDVIILDLGLPDIDGTQVIQRLREWSQTPLIVLSVRSDEQEKVEALDAGADDYVTKPFGISELMARIRVALRGSDSRDTDSGLFQTGDLEVNLITRVVQLQGHEIKLTRKEYELLRLFVTHPDHVLTHQQILTRIWGPAHQNDTHYLRVLVGNLRQKLHEPPTRPRYISTVQGVGYRLATQTD